MNIGILGRTQLLYNTTIAMVKAGHTISFIGTCRAEQEYSKKEDDFAALANHLEVPFFNSLKLNDPTIKKTMLASAPEICISVNWLSIIDESIVSLFPHGILNAHAGDLPRYRGNACMNWAILSGEERVCICVHKMEPSSLDSGDILLKEYHPVTQATRIGELYQWLERVVPEMFVAAVNGLEQATLRPTPQPKDPALGLRCYPRRPEDGRINWDEDVLALERLVNASSEPFHGAFSFWRGQKVTVWRAHTETFSVESLYIPGQVIYRNKATGAVAVGGKNGMLVLESISLDGDTSRTRPANVVKSLRDRFTTYP